MKGIKIFLNIVGTIALAPMTIGILLYLNAVATKTSVQDFVLVIFALGAVAAIISFGIGWGISDGIQTDIINVPKSQPDPLRKYADCVRK